MATKACKTPETFILYSGRREKKDVNLSWVFKLREPELRPLLEYGRSLLTHPPRRLPSRHSRAMATLQAAPQKLTITSWTEAVAVHWMSAGDAKDVRIRDL
jgi:hypothetical protein